VGGLGYALVCVEGCLGLARGVVMGEVCRFFGTSSSLACGLRASASVESDFESGVREVDPAS